MAVTNNAMIIRREVLTRLVKLLKDRKLEEGIDRIPYDLRPKGGELSRCCVYKDRAMLKYKIMAIMGYSAADEVDELTPLSDYAHRAFSHNPVSDAPLNVVEEACSACVKTNYIVTNMCRGCVGRPCMVNCPKDAIKFENGRADIMTDKCVNCGMCQKNCPFHAIIYTPVPCEESCPVGAITKDERGIENIDKDKCVYCGRCLVACPFGAIVEKTHLLNIYDAMYTDKKVIAMVAPAIAGQFKLPLENIMGAIKQLGFTDVIEVAKGADVTTETEAAELVERLEGGAPFMTTSCCPSYTAAVQKHLTELTPFISHTKTPMYYTAEIARKMYPDAVLVFVGPCLGKRYEAFTDPSTDFMLSFEEIGAMFVAYGIDVFKSEAMTLDNNIYSSSRGYAVTSGVMGAVAKHLGDKASIIRPIVIDGLNKQTVRDLKSYPKSCPGNMVEVMMCEGGCVNGCSVIANPKIASRQIVEIAKK